MDNIAKSTKEKKEEEKQAIAEIWDCALAFVPLAVVKCAIELRIADVIETHGGSMTNAELSAALGCSPPVLRRIMRYLTHRGFFSHRNARYVQTPLSRILMRDAENSMAALILFGSSPVTLAPWHNLSSRALLSNGGGSSAFGDAHNGDDIWEYVSANPAHSKLVNDAMACRARVEMSAIIENCPEAFVGVGSLVDVGGGDGTAIRALVKACPWVRGINFDLTHVIASVICDDDGVEHVAGNMFQSVPTADAAFLMAVLHDWSDEECIEIMRKCREAIPEETGKVIIVDAVIRETEEVDDKYDGVRLGLDMLMLAHTGRGKERTIGEWEHVVNEAGFKRWTVKHIDAAAISVIEAYP